uniref:Dehydrogenase/reductase SDR family member 13-like n=1 Tax=Phallusia mammillata TaxID=59560 RepID=A0A6F9DBG8_9ASCI|nr:dehydrogenase/reductase SDR family member 13-like [Phallusia mammillata]
MIQKEYIFLVLAVVFAYYWKNYIITGPIYKTNKRLDGKTVLITGGNVGIGKATAIEFAKLGAKVVIASRNVEKSRKAKDEIIKESGNKNIHVMKLDLGDFSSIKSFAEKIHKEEENLHYLINNAGVFAIRGMTDYGYNRIMAINHFGPFLLTHLLMDKIKQQSKSSPVRIINLSSVAYQFGAFDFEMWHHDSSSVYQDFLIYGQSKLANIYFTSELNKRLKGFDITTYAVHPGGIRSELGMNDQLSWPLYIYKQFITLLLREPIYGAQTTLYCALDDNVTQLSGNYFGETTMQDLKDFAKDDVVGQKNLAGNCESYKRLSPKRCVTVHILNFAVC